MRQRVRGVPRPIQTGHFHRDPVRPLAQGVRSTGAAGDPPDGLPGVPGAADPAASDDIRDARSAKTSQGQV